MSDYGANWNALRRMAIERDEFRCAFCGMSSQQCKLHVHHNIRPLGKMGGLNVLWNLITLCPQCHAEAHAFIRQFGLSVIPSEEYENHRYELTDRDAVKCLISRLRDTGNDTAYLEEIEKSRPDRSRA